MVTNVSSYLDCSAEKYFDKVAFVDDRRSITFGKLQEEVLHIASVLVHERIKKRPIVVYLDKSVECVGAFIGIAKSGNFYSLIDVEMPIERIKIIMNTLQPQIIITDESHAEQAKKFCGDLKVLTYEKMQELKIDYDAVSDSSKQILDSDLLYVLFTSGSTGIPKGVMISERGIIDLTEWSTKQLNIDETTVFGLQVPFYFSSSVYELYLTLKNGSTTYIIPKEYFSYPATLMEYLYDNEVNTLVWVPSALCMISNFRALHSPHLDKLKNVFFGAEVMPVKQLNRWMDAYPNARFMNLYGSTEVSDTCTYYEINRRLKETELLPLGQACTNKELMVLNENNLMVTSMGEIGELCVRGSGISYGYYHNEDRTKEVFVQNPLNNDFRDIIYRTGDLVKFNEYGELVYVSRKDYQIKHLGQRIELGEIETVASAVEEIEMCCCLYDAEKKMIVLFYTGDIDAKRLQDNLKELLPAYMIPNKFLSLDKMPLNLNGKMDRQKLKDLM